MAVPSLIDQSTAREYPSEVIYHSPG